MSLLSNYHRFLVRRIFPTINARLITTSQPSLAEKGKDVCPPPKSKTVKIKDENWITYGFDADEKSDDRRAMHSVMFFSVTVCLVFGFYYIAYLPDYHLRDWSQREAFLELRRREAAGKPLVDPNYIPAAQMKLPSDDQIGKAQIII